MTTYNFEVAAKNAVINFNETNNNEKYVINDISIVWFCKTLGNMKAILIDNGKNNRMFEATFNGDKQQMYLDCYNKTENVCYEFDEMNFVVKTD